MYYCIGGYIIRKTNREDNTLLEIIERRT